MREDQMSWREGKWLRTIHVVSEVSGKLDADQHELLAARDALITAAPLPEASRLAAR